MYATIFHNVRARDETVTSDITLMNRKGSASVDSTVLSRSQLGNRYFLMFRIYLRKQGDCLLYENDI